MQPSRAALALLALALLGQALDDNKKHHHHHHHKHKGKHDAANATTTDEKKETAVKAPVADTKKVKAVAAPAVVAKAAVQTATSKEQQIVSKMKKLEKSLAAKEGSMRGVLHRGSLEVNGPLPADFDERFVQAAAKAANCDPAEIKMIETHAVNDGSVVELIFEAPSEIVSLVEHQAADPDSALANSPLHSFLVEKDSSEPADMAPEQAIEAHSAGATYSSSGSSSAAPVKDSGIDIDTAMPYGELEPFGREDTAQELTENSVSESNEMVDQLERAEVSEEKRAVFRALTRLRGAAITSFDGVARSQTGNIDEYNKVHKWRNTHPLHHLADEESDISKWAFPDNADF